MEPSEKPLILLVDDDLHLLRGLGDCLEYEGFRVAKATRAEEALEMLDGLSPSLIVLDLRMPGLGGPGFLDVLSSRDDHPVPRVLIYTAHPENPALEQSEHVVGTLLKPCPHRVLAAHVRSALVVHSYQHRATDSGMQVLLAENDDRFAGRIRELLGSAGHTTTIVSDGMAVLEFATSAVPDVIVMKQGLPMMKGTSVAPLIAVMPRTRDVPVLVYSAVPLQEGLATDSVSAPAGVHKLVVTAEPKDIFNAVEEALGQPA